MDPSGGALALPAAAAFVSHFSMLSQEWVKQNWGLKSFVRSFLNVVEKQRQHFEECCDRLQKLNLTQSAMTAEFSPEEKKQLNVQMRIVLKDLEAFLRSKQNLVNKIANHYRLSKQDHAQICNAIDDMNVIMRQVHTTLRDCFAFLGSKPESFPALIHIHQVNFHRQSYAAKLTRTGGPAPLRCSGNATVAEIALSRCDRELHSRYQSIHSDISELVKLQSRLAMENDQRVQKALREQREAFTAKLRANEAEAAAREYHLRLENKELKERKARSVQEPIADAVPVKPPAVVDTTQIAVRPMNVLFAGFVAVALLLCISCLANKLTPTNHCPLSASF